jgi:hypothetical protein
VPKRQHPAGDIDEYGWTSCKYNGVGICKGSFTLTTEEMADKWYGGKDTIIGFYVKE